MKVFDFIGIGFGPANIALAIQLQEKNLEQQLDYVFIDGNKNSLWQQEMLIQGSDIQNVPFRDLITPINPQSHYSFMNYLHKNDKYFRYFNTGLKYPLRKDYAMYINWCAEHFKDIVHYEETVISIEIDADTNYYVLSTNVATYYAKTIIVATGRSLYIPPVFNNIPPDKLITINNFCSKTNKLNREKSYNFAVVGASQSAAEIFLDLSNKFYNSVIHSYIRQFSFAMKDLSPFSYEIYFPGFIDEYYEASNASKTLLNTHLRRTNYSSVDPDILEQINLKIYEESLDNNFRLEIKRNSEITSIDIKEPRVLIGSQNNINGKSSHFEYDFVIVCTGFKDLGKGENKEILPPLLEKFMDKVILRNNKDMTQYISENYELFIENTKHPIFLNGLCETSHGMGDSGSFSLISIRVNKILNSLLKHVNQKVSQIA
jgi:L-ornithine N5-monooxygenase